MIVYRAIPAATAIALFTSVPAAYAQTQDAVRAACRGDVIRYCRSAVGDREKMQTCLAENRNNLSEACRAALMAFRDAQGN